ncbi:hypothetical protein [Pantoea agglomerans]|uniref:hypothetical protein n=1 Tax=Enterobacter agglomerans TaxID=549 RepID=UPI0006DD529C|nr:hypothetical protein [Pantoea agglomerans]KPA06241.1 hypothetical protein PAP10c_2343 [Pantoea agglomerans]
MCKENEFLEYNTQYNLEINSLLKSYGDEDISTLLSRWKLDKKRKPYTSILKEILHDVPENIVTHYQFKWRYIYLLFDASLDDDGIAWSHSVRCGEIMLKEASQIKIQNTPASPSMLYLASNILSKEILNVLLTCFGGEIMTGTLNEIIYNYISFKKTNSL